MADIELDFIDITLNEKITLLDILGYYVDENGVIYNKDTKEQHICPYTNEIVLIENASILPGSTVIINTTELSISEYFTEHIDKLAI